MEKLFGAIPPLLKTIRILPHFWEKSKLIFRDYRGLQRMCKVREPLFPGVFRRFIQGKRVVVDTAGEENLLAVKTDIE
ncbi:MAG: hypothetical protein LUC90_09525 [Lachnospiraceae bacterium]|nr:hypothetical protein [Lachnospiraceae bacterium]